MDNFLSYRGRRVRLLNERYHRSLHNLLAQQIFVLQAPRSFTVDQDKIFVRVSGCALLNFLYLLNQLGGLLCSAK